MVRHSFFPVQMLILLGGWFLNFRHGHMGVSCTCSLEPILVSLQLPFNPSIRPGFPLAYWTWLSWLLYFFYFCDVYTFIDIVYIYTFDTLYIYICMYICKHLGMNLGRWSLRWQYGFEFQCPANCWWICSAEVAKHQNFWGLQVWLMYPYGGFLK
jgi:hypothetical protein